MLKPGQVREVDLDSADNVYENLNIQCIGNLQEETHKTPAYKVVTLANFFTTSQQKIGKNCWNLGGFFE